MKKAIAIAGAVALGPTLLIAPVAVALAGSSSAQAACSADGTQAVDSAAVAKLVKSILKGDDKGSVSVSGLSDPEEQIANAETIQATGIAMKVPARGQIVALATALQESGLRNLDYGDRDSLGLFQQRPSQGWGTAAEVRDPVHASTKFYEGLLKVSGWQSMTVAQAAQAVQKSGFPDAYAKREPLATALQKAIAKSLGQDGSSGTGGDTGSEAEEASSSTATACGTGDDGSSFGPIPAGAVPEGYEIPASAPKSVRTAIRWGLGQLGTPYQWGGSCSAPHGQDPMGRCDCSSLMQASYKAGGVSISRTTYTQVKEGKAVSVDALKPGDLLFTRGTASAPEHVGMFVGQGLILQAPKTGDVVKISTLADWRVDIVAARRIV
ncbi:C40 family peptidase [Streptomyces violaceochromogenes]|uniref:C40 family peptidase n=1 Tax=Streptomyces violaceochromogenes TaxID=67377 RepID=A0ABU6M6A1_9ACTN|nr:C40 family peptidase [Streptomyces violaceochromogenes]MEC7055674.1 C40 family peptidase [Streptomyces violaceochromogenes]